MIVSSGPPNRNVGTEHRGVQTFAAQVPVSRTVSHVKSPLISPLKLYMKKEFVGQSDHMILLEGLGKKSRAPILSHNLY
jgi:hypothetical protein